MNLCLDGVDRIGGLDLKGDSPGSEGLNEDLHTAMETGTRWRMDVVVQKVCLSSRRLPAKMRHCWSGGMLCGTSVTHLHFVVAESQDLRKI